jgi:ATP-dependent Clp protease ATP-binding subunit ClpC
VGKDEKYGARPLKRAMQTKIEDALTDEILSGNVKAGDIVSVGVHNKKCTFHVTQK